jgi:hypothetical protein
MNAVDPLLVLEYLTLGLVLGAGCGELWFAPSAA